MDDAVKLCMIKYFIKCLNYPGIFLNMTSLFHGIFMSANKVTDFIMVLQHWCLHLHADAGHLLQQLSDTDGFTQ